MRRAFIKDTRAEKNRGVTITMLRDVYGCASFPVISTRKTEIKSASYRVR